MRKGFTLIELVIAMALMAAFVLFGVPFGVEAYQDYVLTSTTRDLVSVLRRAQTLAATNTGASAYGVAFSSDHVVLFKGSSYPARDPAFDEAHTLSPALRVVALPEIVFAPLSGAPAAASTVVVTSGLRVQTIEVNPHGVVVW